MFNRTISCPSPVIPRKSRIMAGPIRVVRASCRRAASQANKTTKTIRRPRCLPSYGQLHVIFTLSTIYRYLFILQNTLLADSRSHVVERSIACGISNTPQYLAVYPLNILLIRDRAHILPPLTILSFSFVVAANLGTFNLVTLSFCNPPLLYGPLSLFLAKAFSQRSTS